MPSAATPPTPPTATLATATLRHLLHLRHLLQRHLLCTSGDELHDEIHLLGFVVDLIELDDVGVLDHLHDLDLALDVVHVLHLRWGKGWGEW